MGEGGGGGGGADGWWVVGGRGGVGRGQKGGGGRIAPTAYISAVIDCAAHVQDRRGDAVPFWGKYYQSLSS